MLWVALSLPMIADLTREEQRTKAMAINGMTIGMSFSLAMILGPVAVSFIQVNGIFWLAALFSVIAIIMLGHYGSYARTLQLA